MKICNKDTTLWGYKQKNKGKVKSEKRKVKSEESMCLDYCSIRYRILHSSLFPYPTDSECHLACSAALALHVHAVL